MRKLAGVKVAARCVLLMLILLGVAPPAQSWRVGDGRC